MECLRVSRTLCPTILFFDYMFMIHISAIVHSGSHILETGRSITGPGKLKVPLTASFYSPSEILIVFTCPTAIVANIPEVDILYVPSPFNTRP